jgi:hypothetical protein
LRHDEDLLEGAQRLATAMVKENGPSLAAMIDELHLFVDDDEATYLFKS